MFVNFAQNIPRKWFLASTLQAALAENPEEHSRQNFSESLNNAKIRAPSSMPRQTYSGDRFIPCRRGYSFEAAHCLLRKESEDTEGSITIDVHKQVRETRYLFKKYVIHNYSNHILILSSSICCMLRINAKLATR